MLSINLGVFLGGIEGRPVVYVAEAEEPQVVLIATTTKEVAPKVPAVLSAIADCESGDRRSDGSAIPNTARQFNPDGSVVKNPASSATGKYQIMASLHAANAREMGHDIYTEEGNEGFALHLFETQGAKPWLASVKCHGIY